MAAEDSNSNWLSRIRKKITPDSSSKKSVSKASDSGEGASKASANPVGSYKPGFDDLAEPNKPGFDNSAEPHGDVSEERPSFIVGDPETSQSAEGSLPPALTKTPQSERPTSFGGLSWGLTKYGLGSWYLIGIGLVVAFIIFATTRVQMVFIALFVALVLTSLLNPAVRWLSRWMPRALATAISLLGTFVFFGGMLFYVGYSVSGEWNDLSDKFSSGLAQIFGYLENSPLSIGDSHKEVNENLQDIFATVMQWIQDNAGSVASQAVNSASTAALIFAMLALAIFAAIFFLLSGQKMWLWFVNLVPARNRVNLHRSATAGWKTFSGYARGTIIIAVTDGILAAILLLALSIPLAAPLAVLVMIGAVIPLVGAPAAMVIAMIVALAADGVVKAAVVGIGIALIGQFEGHILQPLVMGRQVSLHPVAVAVGVAAGTFLAGLVGAIIAIPIIAVIWEVYKTLRHPDPPIKSLDELEAPAGEE
ncbi:AI-2E family transporter [Actinomycetaceae bacterium L2_0104]